MINNTPQAAPPLAVSPSIGPLFVAMFARGTFGTGATLPSGYPGRSRSKGRAGMKHRLSTFAPLVGTTLIARLTRGLDVALFGYTLTGQS